MCAKQLGLCHSYDCFMSQILAKSRHSCRIFVGPLGTQICPCGATVVWKPSVDFGNFRDVNHCMVRTHSSKTSQLRHPRHCFSTPPPRRMSGIACTPLATELSAASSLSYTSKILGPRTAHHPGLTPWLLALRLLLYHGAKAHYIYRCVTCRPCACVAWLV